jgi:hypothetical protein
VLQSGGFSTFEIEDRTMTFDFPSVEAYLQIVSEVAGWTRRLEALSAGDRFRLRQAVADAAGRYCVDGRVRVGSAVHCAVGRR